MVITVDGTNQLIILPAGTAGVLNVSVERDLYSAWKTWFKLPGNAKYQLAFRGSVGGDVLSGVLEAGAYFFLQNQLGWRIRPFEENGDIVFSGNLIAEDSTLPVISKTLGAFTVLISGLQPITQNISAADVEHASYGDGVTIDVANGTAGTTGTIGNKRTPVNNLTDANIIGAARGLKKRFIIDTITFISTDILDGLEIIGASSITKNIITFDAGASTVDTKIEKCVVVGTLKGRIDAEGVIFQNIVDMDYDSWLLDCWFSGNISLKGNGNFAAINCGSTFPPGSTSRPVIDYTKVPLAKSNFLRWSGNIGLMGVTAGNIELNIGSGKIFLEVSNTGGTLFLRSEHPDINDETPANGLKVVSELLRFSVVSDAVNTNTTFKTDLAATQTDVYKDSIIQVLETTTAAGLAGEVKKVLSYNGTTKFIALTSALSGIPAANTRLKMINE